MAKDDIPILDPMVVLELARILDDNLDIMLEARRLPRKVKLDGGKQRCSKCGFRIRGRYHAEGPHHNSGMRRGCTFTRRKF